MFYRGFRTEIPMLLFSKKCIVSLGLTGTIESVAASLSGTWTCKRDVLWSATDRVVEVGIRKRPLQKTLVIGLRLESIGKVEWILRTRERDVLEEGLCTGWLPDNVLGLQNTAS